MAKYTLPQALVSFFLAIPILPSLFEKICCLTRKKYKIPDRTRDSLTQLIFSKCDPPKD